MVSRKEQNKSESREVISITKKNDNKILINEEINKLSEIRNEIDLLDMEDELVIHSHNLNNREQIKKPNYNL